MAFKEASVQSACSNEEESATRSRLEEQSFGTHPEISTSIALGDAGEILEEGVAERRLPSSGVDVQNLATSGFIGEGEVELSVKSSRTTKSWVNGVRSVGGSNDNDLTWERKRRKREVSVVWSEKAVEDDEPRPSIPSMRASRVDTMEA